MSKSGEGGVVGSGNGLVESAASCGVFLGTGLVWLWQMRQRAASMEKIKEEQHKRSLMRWYTQRRMEDRLSFHELDRLGPSPMNSFEEVLVGGEDSTAQIPEYQQHEYPNTSNWCHFEGFQCDDDDQEKEYNSKLVATKGKLALSRASSVSSDNLDKMLEGDDLIEEESLDSAANGMSDEANFAAQEMRFPTGPSTTSTSDRKRRGLRVISEGHRGQHATNGSESPPSTPIRNKYRHSQSFPNQTAPTKQDKPASLSPISKKLRRRRTHSDPEVNSSASLTESTLNECNLVKQNRTARARYNARIMPDKLILVRHGQSMGNIDEGLYSTTPDNAMPLTELGWQQAREAGKQLKQKLLRQQKDSVHFIISPYARTVETFHGIASAWCDPSEFYHIADHEKRLKAWYSRLMELGLTWQEDPRIREQDFGNYHRKKIKQAKRDRHHFGAFYYRFPHGESASDVFDRISTFLDSLWRSFDTNNSKAYVLITHGISIRVLLARYFRYTIGQFHLLANPRNCEMVVLGHDGAGRLELTGRYELELTEKERGAAKGDKATGPPRLAGYKFHKQLRVLPPKSVRKVKIRMSFDEKW